MNKFKKIILIFSAFVLALSLGGCISVKDDSQPKGYMGVFKSEDAGVTWKLKGSLLNIQGKVIPLINVSVNKLILDPNDSNTIYLLSEQGLYYSYDAGASWTKSKHFENSNILDMAIDYQDKCNLYVATGTTLSKSTDCGRTFTSAYVDERSDARITDIETDRYPGNQNVIYLANSKGEFKKSEDFGGSWRNIRSYGKLIKQIILDADDTRIIYLVLDKYGLAKSADSGTTWVDGDPMNKEMGKQFKNSKNSRFLIQDLSGSNAFFYVSDYGILKTIDGAQTWQKINLVSPTGGKDIYSLAVDPANNDIIYYGTDAAIYKSVDGGNTWTTQKAPNVGYVNALIIDPKNPKSIYLGAKQIPKD